MPQLIDDEERKPTELRNIRVKEISLVDRPAIRRKFLLWKRAKPEGGISMPKLTEAQAQVIEDALNSPSPEEEKLIKSLGLKDDEANLAVAALRSLHALGDEAGEALVKELAGEPEPEPTPEPTKEPEVKKTATENKATPVTLPEEVLQVAKSATTPEAFQEILKAATEQPGAMQITLGLVAASNAELKKRDEEITTLRKTVDALTQKDEDREIADLVEKTDPIGVSREDAAKFVKSLAPEQRETWAAQMKAAREAANISTLITQVGTGQAAKGTGDDAYAEVRKLAEDHISKSGDKRTVDEVMLDLLNKPENRSLAERYRNSYRGGSN